MFFFSSKLFNWVIKIFVIIIIELISFLSVNSLCKKRMVKSVVKIGFVVKISFVWVGVV